jgi:hypothetical protein
VVKVITRDHLFGNSKAMAAAVVSSASMIAGGVADVGTLLLVGLMGLVLLYGITARSYLVSIGEAGTGTTPPPADPTGFMGYADAAPSIDDDLRATARTIATPCRCGSEAPAVPVDVAFDSEHTIAVAYLCPDCREPRDAAQLRAEETRRRQADDHKRYVERTAAAARRSTSGDPESYEVFRAKLLLADRVRKFDAAVAADVEHDAAGRVVHVSAERVAQINALAQEVTAAKAAIEAAAKAARGARAFMAPGSAAPAPGLMIASGDYVYEVPWHAEDDLCDEDDHEWETLHSHQREVPLRTICATCGARRWPRVQQITDPDTGEHLGDYDYATGKAADAPEGCECGRHPSECGVCPACSGRGQRFGYRCDPCSGTGYDGGVVPTVQ